MFWLYMLTVWQNNTGTVGKVLHRRPYLHSQSAENTLDIIPKKGVIKMYNKKFKIIEIFQ